MNVIRFISLVLIAVTCAACSPMIGQPGYGAAPETRIPRRHESPRYAAVPERYYAASRIAGPIAFFVDTTVVYSDPSELPEGAILAIERPDDKWVINGGLVPSRIVTTNRPPPVYGRTYRPGGVLAGLGTPFPGMSASLATLILADVDKGRNPCESSSQWKDITAFGFVTGLGVFALTGDPGIGLAAGLLSSLGASNSSNWSCDYHKRFRWSLLATIEAAQPRCLETLQQRQVNGKLNETLTRQCAAVEQKNFKRIDEVVAAPAAAPASASARTERVTPARLREATPDKSPK